MLCGAKILVITKAAILTMAPHPKIAVTVSQRGEPCRPLNRFATSTTTAGTIWLDISIRLPNLGELVSVKVQNDQICRMLGGLIAFRHVSPPISLLTV